MYRERQGFSLPPLESALWRYTSFTKFVSLLDRQALFFARADKLRDSHEGSLSKVNASLRPKVYKVVPEHIQEALASARELMPRYTLLNCWYSSDYESDAMWRIYSGSGEGIAIKTDAGSLVSSLRGDDDIFVGKVVYEDYETAFIPDINFTHAFLRKRKNFEHKREVRALFQRLPKVAELDAGPHEGPIEVCDVGMYVDVDTAELIKEVVVAPEAQDWFFELVEGVASRYGLDAPVRKSELAEEPVWI